MDSGMSMSPSSMSMSPPPTPANSDSDTATPSLDSSLVLNQLSSLGGSSNSLPQFISVTNLPIDMIFTITKVVKRIAGEDGAKYTGIHLYLEDNYCRTNLPSNIFFLFFLL